MSFVVKKINNLPLGYTPDTLYCMKHEDGFKFYLSDKDGLKIHPVVDEVYEAIISYVVVDLDGKIEVGDNLHHALCKLQTQLNKVANKGRVLTKGKVYENTYDFIAVVEAVDGNWTLDYTEAGFKEVISVVPIAKSVGAGLADRRLASLSHVAYTNTSASGKLMGATVAGLIVNTMAESSGPVEVTVRGI